MSARCAVSAERKVFREKVVDVLTEKLRHVVQAMNRQQYLPHTPPQAELDLVFDTSFPDVQPYLFRVSTGYIQPRLFRIGTREHTTHCPFVST